MQQSLKTIIIENEFQVGDRLQRLMQRHGMEAFDSIDYFTSYAKAYEALTLNDYKVSLLDIKLDHGHNVFKLLEEFGIEKFGLIIFTTQLNNTPTIRNEQFKPFRTITKPYSESKVKGLISDIKSEILRRDRFYSVKEGKISYRLNYDDIYFIESSGKYVKFTCTNTAAPFYLHIQVENTLKELLTKLDTRIFRRCHNSYIVNMEKIQKIASGGSRRGTIYFKNTAIPEIAFNEDFWSDLEDWGFVI